MKKKLLFTALFLGGLYGGNAQDWKTAGNLSSCGQEYVLGTAAPLFCQETTKLANPNFEIIHGGQTMIRFDGYIKMAPLSSTKVLIGDPTTTTTPGNYKLYVETGIMTEKVKVALKATSDWSDYIFEGDYDLMPLNELEVFIDTYGHLPNIPSAKELVNEGMDLGNMQAKQMAKIEELTLYMIQKDKEIEALQKQVALLSKQMELLLEKE